MPHTPYRATDPDYENLIVEQNNWSLQITRTPKDRNRIVRVSILAPGETEPVVFVSQLGAMTELRKVLDTADPTTALLSAIVGEGLAMLLDPKPRGRVANAALRAASEKIDVVRRPKKSRSGLTPQGGQQ